MKLADFARPPCSDPISSPFESPCAGESVVTRLLFSDDIELSGLPNSPMTNIGEVHKNSIPNTKEAILEDFKNFCKTTRELKEGTVKLHSIFVKKLLEHLGTKHPTELIERDISGFKETFNSSSPSVRANLIKAMRIFVRDYLGKGDEVKRFKLPTIKFVPKISPTDEEIRAFYNMLKRPREKALYLLLATSGLRKHELLSLKREDFNFEQRMIIPKVRNVETGQVEGSQTKHQLVTYYNQEAAQAFCGRSPQTILGRHYTGYNELKQIYDNARLKVLQP